MYLYSGASIFQHPDAWTWAVPSWFTQLVQNFMPIEAYLRLQAIGELIFALVFLAWFLKPILVKYVALLATLEMAGIVFLGKAGIDLITFRDLGLLGGLIALLIMASNRARAEKPGAAE